ncbi:MAG: hypothetical protein IJ523_10530 [Succinivibrionaceae bacterium]|nr:hypothetical protein [Succinivibrionaceae bacterium]
MSSLYETIGTKNYKNLLAEPNGDPIAIPCKPGNGSLAIGTLMYREASGMYSPAAAAQAIDANMLVVLGEDVDTGSAPASGETAVAEDALAYRAGTFIEGTVKLAAGAALTAAIKVVLRKQNIVFDQDTTAVEFDNTVTGS